MLPPQDLQLISTSPPRGHAIAAVAPPRLIAPVSSAQDDGGARMTADVFLIPPCRPVNKTEELLV